jgi:C4-dicarboxylate-specific signal transduction histidine kinase
MDSKLQNGANLRKFDMFENLTADELSLIAKEAEIREFGEGEVVCMEDSESDTMFFIDAGSVGISKRGVSIAQLSAGEYFGEMSLITGDPRNATVTALESSVLLEVSAPVFHVIIERSPRAMRNLLSTYDERLRRHNEKVVEQFLELKQRYEELENSHQRLLLSDKMASVGLLTAGIAHEINNPLFVITGYLDVIDEMVGSGRVSAEELGGISEKLNKASNAIVKLVSGIKTYVRIDDTNPVPIDLNSAIHESLGLVSFLYRQDGIEIRHELATDSPVILGNIGKLQQVLMNLLSNARDAMETSPRKIIFVTTREENGRVVLELADTGSGIAPESLENVFVSGYTTKPVGKGSGMGLDLVRKIIEEMEGSVSVESEVDSGTMFRVEFPRHTG